jgi:hypothetical protein
MRRFLFFILLIMLQGLAVASLAGWAVIMPVSLTVFSKGFTWMAMVYAILTLAYPFFQVACCIYSWLAYTRSDNTPAIVLMALASLPALLVSVIVTFI